MEDEGIFRAEFIPLRCVSGRDWIQRAAFSRARFAVAADARVNRGLPMRAGLPFLRGTSRRKKRTSERSGTKNPGATLRVSKTMLDRFWRVKALQKPLNGAARASNSTLPKDFDKRESTAGEPRGFSANIPEGAGRLAELLGAAPLRNEFGEHLALRKWFSDVADGVKTDCSPLGHGLADERMDASALRLLLPDAAEEAGDPRQWLFLDTETTGIMGGSGTYAFMVGIAWWDAGGLEVEQFFMRELSEEHALLLTLAERMAERPVLVTFNGKSFDWPLLETRYRMTRKIRPAAPRAHLDFLHPARNLWRVRLGSVRLAELEKHVLGWNRGADLISEMIPQFYFDYLRGGPPEPLVQIFLHNQMDLRGLAGLASRIIAVLADPRTDGADGVGVFGG